MAEKISRGNMEAKIDVTEGRDEIGRLAGAFNSMSTKLKKSYEALERRITERDMEIDQRTRTEARLAEQARHLVRSNRELEQFAYVASHDLREPLRMVSSYTQLLRSRYTGRLDADADEFIGFAVDGAARMQVLIDDLLAYSRVGANGMSTESTDCNIVFERAVANLAATIDENDAIVTHDDLPTIEGDASQLSQVFQNLMANAIKFRQEDAPSVHVSARLDGPQWIFSVKDNGIGIDPEYAERIFVIFQRLHTREEYQGTGMGLAICKKIVERHRGEIWVDSEAGKGATFYFTISRNGSDDDYS
jgi:light-regulated signal transduction histidine kinase (bacteriophytochrome)